MKENDIIQLFLITGQNIDSLWQFFVTVHLAIFGAFFVLHKLKNSELLIFSLSYILFSMINIRAKIILYNTLKSIGLDLKLSTIHNMKTTEYLSNIDFNDRLSIVLFIHLFSASCVYYLVYQTWKNKNHKNKHLKT